MKLDFYKVFTYFALLKSKFYKPPLSEQLRLKRNLFIKYKTSKPSSFKIIVAESISKSY